MSTTTQPTTTSRITGAGWLLALIPLLLLGVILTYIVITGGGLSQMAGPPLNL